MNLRRKTTGGLLVAGGVAVLAASPLAARLRFGVRSRLAALAYRHDPVAPFCAAPCYERGGPTEGADKLTGHTEALP
jgi:hypothetical protein